MGGLFLAIIVVALVFIAINPNFANLNLGVSVLRAMSSVAIMAMGLTLVIVVGEIDLSFGAMYGLAANALAVALDRPWACRSIWRMLIAIGVGALVGAVQRPAGDRLQDTLLHRHARQLQSALRRCRCGSRNTATFNPTYPPPGVEKCRKASSISSSA